MYRKQFCFLLTLFFLCAVSHLEGGTRKDDSTADWRYAPGWDSGLAKQKISPFDRVIREESLREGHDWRLLSAIAYNESRFIPDLVSGRGAMGLMQIMPATARQFEVQQSRVMDPRTNVRLAARLLTEIQESLRMRSATDEDRMRIVLACYNGGIGHVLDARSLARKYGANPDSWADVSLYLELKSNPDYSSDDVVRCGSFNGSGETLSFVDKVMKRYQRYKTVAPA